MEKDVEALATEAASREKEMQAELEMLRETEERYRIVADTASDAIITIDESSTILFVNPASEKIFGHKLEEMLGAQLTMLMPEYLRHLHRAGIERFIETGKKHISWTAVELPGLHKSGREVPLELSFGEFTRHGKRYFTGIVRDITERKRAEQRLVAQYAVTRTLAESDSLRDAAPKILQAICETLGWEMGAVWRVDQGAQLLYCVESWRKPEFTGTEFEAISRERTFSHGIGLPGRVWQSGVTEWVTNVLEDDNFPRASLAKKAGLHGACAFPILFGNEVRGVMEFFSREIKQPDEKIVKMMHTVGSQVGQFVERRRAEADLQASEQRYRYLADSMPQIVFTARADGYLDYYNKRWFEYTGMTLEQTEGWGWQPVLHPDDVEPCLKRWSRSVETGERYEIEYRFRRASDGAYRWHLGRALPMRDATGAIVKWFGTCTDIDDQKRAQASLLFIAEASEMLASSLDYETTLKNVAGLAVPRLADWCVIHMLGEDGRAHQLAAAHADESRLRLLKELNRNYPEGLETFHSYPLVLRTGRSELIPEITDEMLANVSRDQGHLQMLRDLALKSTLCVPLIARGRTLGAITFATAESGRIYSSSDLILAEDLAHRAATAVDNARLYQQAQEANLIKEEFLATLSHELRTPLTPIIGWVHMIRGGMIKGTDIERGLAVVDRSSQALTRLINDLLDMSAILSGKMRIEQLPVSLNTALKESIETVRPQAESRNITLELSLCTDEPVLIGGDRTRLVQIFWNILSNAVKFSSEGQRVRITCQTDGDEARVIIEDEGKGIKPDFLPFVFDRFRQADSSKTREHGGLGLGLSLVQSFAHAHGGSVMVESSGLGHGSRFIVSLPRLHPPAEDESAARMKAEKDSAGSGVHVLIVEDASDTLEMLHKALKARGYETTLCESAEEALTEASNATFDLVISDIGMPDMDGYELIRRLRQLPHLNNVPAIALSGYATEGDIEDALAAGFDAHVAKPVEPSQLTAEMERVLQSKRDKAGSDK